MSHIRTKRSHDGVSRYLVDEINGKQISKKLPVGSLKEAESYRLKHEAEKLGGRPTVLFLKDMTFFELTQEYQEYSKPRKMPSTFQSDVSLVKILNSYIGNYRLKQLTTLSIQNIQSVWIKEGSSKKTVNNRAILLGTILRFGIERGYLVELPRITKFKIDRRRPQFYTEDELKRMIENASPFLRDYIMVLAHTGLRSGELQRLKWEDIDFNNNLVRVEIAKSHRFRTIPMSNTLRKLLTELHAQKNIKQIYIFECNEGKPVSDFYHRFKRLLKRLDIDGHVHKLRHTFASYLVQNGVSIYEVQQLLGHASVQTTQVYAHIRMDNLQRAVSTLDLKKSDGMETGRNQNVELRIA